MESNNNSKQPQLMDSENRLVVARGGELLGVGKMGNRGYYKVQLPAIK